MAVKVKINTIEAHFQNAMRGGNRCIARAPNGMLWTAYGHWDNPDGGLLAAYSSDGGATWTEEVVTTEEEIYPWDGISLVISLDNVPHIIYSYYPAPGGDCLIRYISRVGGSWGTPETVFDTGSPAGMSVIKARIDNLDNIHIVYERLRLYYIVGVSGTWSIPEEADPNGTRPDLTINNSNEPVIVFVDGAGIQVRYRTAGVWQPVDTVNVPTGGTPVPVIEVDNADDYHVAWYAEEPLAPWNYEVYYRKKEGGVWLAVQELATNVDEWYVGIGLDDADNAYVFYQTDGADEAVYCRKVTDGITLGAETVIDAGILRPNNDPSTFAFLYHKYPTSGVLAASYQPIVVLLDEVPVGFPYADLYFYAGAFLPMPAGSGGNPGVVELLT